MAHISDIMPSRNLALTTFYDIPQSLPKNTIVFDSETHPREAKNDLTRKRLYDVFAYFGSNQICHIISYELSCTESFFYIRVCF